MRYLLFLSAAKYCGLRGCVSARGATEENSEKDGERAAGKEKEAWKSWRSFGGLEQSDEPHSPRIFLRLHPLFFPPDHQPPGVVLSKSNCDPYCEFVPGRNARSFRMYLAFPDFQRFFTRYARKSLTHDSFLSRENNSIDEYTRIISDISVDPLEHLFWKSKIFYMFEKRERSFPTFNVRF